EQPRVVRPVDGEHALLQALAEALDARRSTVAAQGASAAASRARARPDGRDDAAGRGASVAGGRDAGCRATTASRRVRVRVVPAALVAAVVRTTLATIRPTEDAQQARTAVDARIAQADDGHLLAFRRV